MDCKRLEIWVTLEPAGDYFKTSILFMTINPITYNGLNRNIVKFLSQVNNQNQQQLPSKTKLIDFNKHKKHKK